MAELYSIYYFKYSIMRVIYTSQKLLRNGRTVRRKNVIIYLHARTRCRRVIVSKFNRRRQKRCQFCATMVLVCLVVSSCVARFYTEMLINAVFQAQAHTPPATGIIVSPHIDARIPFRKHTTTFKWISTYFLFELVQYIFPIKNA